MSQIKSYEDLNIYQRSYRLALEIHKATLKFPAIERIELGSQMRRASKSVPANIAEGFGRRKFNKEYLRFLGMAKASADEMRVHLKFSHDLGYLNDKEYTYFNEEYLVLLKQFMTLIKIRLNFKE